MSVCVGVCVCVCMFVCVSANQAVAITFLKMTVSLNQALQRQPDSVRPQFTSHCRNTVIFIIDESADYFL